VIDRMFHLTSSLPGVWKLLKRHGWSCRVPARRASERDDQAVVVGKTQGVAARGTTAADLGEEGLLRRRVRPHVEAADRPYPGSARRHAGGEGIGTTRGPHLGGRADPLYRPGERSRLIYRVHLYRRRKDETASFTWTDYRGLIIMAHRQLDAPIVPIWDNLNRHTCAQMRQFIADNAD
jgi:hypothetical protein